MKDYIDESEVERLLDQLHHLRDELQEEQGSLQTAAKPVELDQQSFGRVSRGDAIQQQNMARATLGQCEERLRLIDEALRKIDSEDYGFCSECDEPISIQRLRARPEGALCIKCQSAMEKAP